jgi:hypothetical protein
MSSSNVQWACTVVVWALIGLLDNGDGARRRSSKQGEEDIRLTGKRTRLSSFVKNDDI